ncbi:MAG: GNAT family N-acetyltransferase [Acidimicrobiia bacterium]|nr:GNAT family N-acetyltransferase [Acidimicrobiia bacterium]
MTIEDGFIQDRTGVVDLADGGRILVRPIVPADRAALQAGLERLSPRSRYLRFFSEVERLSARELEYLTDVDYKDHFAWVAMDADGARETPDGVGVGRYIRLEPGSSVAEAAVAVVDAWQRRGVGRVLMALLAQSAVEHGINTLRAYVVAENAELVERLQRVSVEMTERDGLYELDVRLPLESPSVAADAVLQQIAGLNLG